MAPWGRIEGEVIVGDGPGKDVEVTYRAQRYSYGYPEMFVQHVAVQTNAKGAFTIDHVSPGLAQISLFEFFPKPSKFQQGFSGGARPPAGAFTHVTVEAGKLTEVSLGDETLPAPGALKASVK